MHDHVNYPILGWTIALTSFTWNAVYLTPAIAQIIPDGTLGGEASIVSPNQLINGLPSDRIDGGAIRGSNLFHSFSAFNIQDGRAAYFANPNGIGNIIGRVTGGDVSTILGTLGVLGNANLFLINPNGILFGPNAQLDIRGSFVASTSDRLLLSDGTTFSAVNPQAPPLLTVNVPIGLQLGVAQGTIVNAGNLAVGQNLTLHGGSISSSGELTAPNGNITVRSTTGDVALRYLAAQTATIEAAENLNLIGSQLFTQADLTLNAQNTIRIRDTTTQPVMLWAGGTLQLQGDRAIDIFALNNRDSHFVSGRDLILRSSTAIGGDAHYWAGGNVRIEQLDGSLGELYSPYDPIFRAQGDVLMGGYNGFSLHIFAGGQVNISGPIFITGAETVAADTILETVTLQDGSLLQIDGLNRPTLDIRAGTLNIGTPGFTNTAPPIPLIPPPPNPQPDPNLPITGANITVGPIEFSSPNGTFRSPNGTVFLTNNYAPNLGLPAGNITVNGSGINTNAGVGNSGSVTMDARGSINLNAPIDTSSTTGTAGDVRLLARTSIDINAQSANATKAVQWITTNTLPGNNGNAGNIWITAPQVTVQKLAAITANTFGAGTGGTIEINANQLTLDRGFITAITGDSTGNNASASPNTGQGGNVWIFANSVDLRNTSSISVQTNDLSSGDAGTLTIQANRLNVQDRSLIAGTTSGQGRGAVMQLNIADTFTLTGTGNNLPSGQTGIFFGSSGSGNAGSLEILNARQVILQNGASIYANAANTGSAGNVSVNIPNGILQITGVGNNASGQTASGIVAETRNSGRGGDIRVNARQVWIQDGGQISAQTIATGQAGTLAVNASELINISGTNGRFHSRLFFDSSGAGTAGGIQVNTNQLLLSNGGQITVSGTGSGVSGNIDINAARIDMANRAQIRAFTTLSEGGNIFLRLSDPGVSIGMRNNSEISAEAFGFANAGNLTIDAKGMILSWDGLAGNNDIVANAVFGQGGRIGATALLILGFQQFQGKRTPESDFTSLSLNPDFPGEIFINTQQSPNAELPQDIPPKQVAQVCQPEASAEERSEFVVRGTGGIPTRPVDDVGMDEAIAVPLADPVTLSQPVSPQAKANTSPQPAIVEAQRAIQLADGTLKLIAPAVATGLPTPTCQTR